MKQQRLGTYQGHGAVSWTRIDMLLALYDAALLELEKARIAHDQADHLLAKRHCIKALRVICQLRSGVDPHYGDLSRQFDRLFEFVTTCIAGGSVANVADAVTVLSTLREGFEGIREEAVEMEKNGTIPPLEFTPTLEKLV